LYVFSGAREAVVGEITLEDLSGSDMDGYVNWFRSAIPHAAYFANGFSAQPQFLASTFTPPGRGQTILSFGDTSSDNASVSIGGADVNGTSFNGIVENSGRFVPDTSTSPPRAFALTLGVGGGAAGSFIDPTSGRRASFVGMVLQKQNLVAGYFLTAAQSGYIQLTPAQ
jgi:hypothetical protein